MKRGTNINIWNAIANAGYIKWDASKKTYRPTEYPLNLKDFRVNRWYLVKTDEGIRLLNKEEYDTFMGETHILYQGSYQACKDYIKV